MPSEDFVIFLINILGPIETAVLDAILSSVTLHRDHVQLAVSHTRLINAGGM
jgi:hypothetical protein